MTLSHESSDYYHGIVGGVQPPLSLEIITVGPRAGWRWMTRTNDFCDVTWLDLEPNANTDGHKLYRDVLEYFEESTQFSCVYKGLTVPPTEEEYHRIRNAQDAWMENMQREARARIVDLSNFGH